MTHPNVYTVNPGWRILLLDAGLNPVDVLRRSGLPDDLFGREKATLTTEQYFRLWRGVEEEAADPTLPLRIGSAISVEAFDPPIFAAMCSQDLNTALGRIARHKRLICPMALDVDAGPKSTTLGLEWLDTATQPPVSLVATELVFFVQLARIATRSEIRPLEVRAPAPPEPGDAYSEFFGVPIGPGSRPSIAFTAEDATRPFLTANEKMWQFFEPELRRRLSELDETATVADRVRGALLELLPGGDASMAAVAAKLAVSTRTLQRRLAAEESTYQEVLAATREELARHYLAHSSMSGAEISFLLGFTDPNSFFRAFHSWTGQTPNQVRTAAVAG